MKKFWKLLIAFILGLVIGFSVPIISFKMNSIHHHFSRQQIRYHHSIQFKNLSIIEKKTIDSLRSLIKENTSLIDKIEIRKQMREIIKNAN